MSQGNEDGGGPTRRQVLGLLGAGGITTLGAALILTGARVSPTDTDDNESSDDGGGEDVPDSSMLSVAWDATYGDGEPSAFTAAAGPRSPTVPSSDGGETNESDETGNETADGNESTDGAGNESTDGAGNESDETGNETADGNESTDGAGNESTDGAGNESGDGDGGTDAVIFGGVLAENERSGRGWLVGVEGPETTTFDETYAPRGAGERAFAAVESVIPSGDGWALVGWTHEPSSDGEEASDSKYPWLARVDGDGNSLWRRTYGRPNVVSNRDVFYDGVGTADGGYLLAGVTLGEQFDDTRRGDGWLAKVGPEGELEWERTYAPGGADHTSWSEDDQFDGFETIRAIDGGYLLGGAATPKGTSDTEPADGWIVAVDESGAKRWSSTYKFGEDSDTADFSIEDVGPAADGFLAVGTAGSYEYVRPIRQNQLVGDGWIAGLGPEGGVRWERTVADASIRATARAGDAGRIVAGARENRPWVGLIDDEGEFREELALHEADGVVSSATVREDGAIVLAGRRDDGETPVAFVTQLSPPADASDGDDGGG